MASAKAPGAFDLDGLSPATVKAFKGLAVRMRDNSRAAVSAEPLAAALAKGDADAFLAKIVARAHAIIAYRDTPAGMKAYKAVVPIVRELVLAALAVRLIDDAHAAKLATAIASLPASWPRSDILYMLGGAYGHEAAGQKEVAAILIEEDDGRDIHQAIEALLRSDPAAGFKYLRAVMKAPARGSKAKVKLDACCDMLERFSTDDENFYKPWYPLLFPLVKSVDSARGIVMHNENVEAAYEKWKKKKK